MSYIDTCEDELDYGEEELGERDAAPISFQAGDSVPALADDEMVLEEDYEDLYEDVNIGYFQSPAEPAKQGVADAGSALGLEHNEEAKPRTQGKGPGTYATEQKRGTDAAALQEPSRVIKQEDVKALKEEPTDTMELTPGPWSRDVNYGHEGQFKEEPFPSPIPEKGVKVSQMLSATPKEEEDGYSNGQGLTTLHHRVNNSFPPNMESGAAGTLPSSGNGEVALGTAQMASGTNFDNAGSADRGFPGGPGKVLANVNIAGRGAADMSLEGGGGTLAGPPWPSHAGTQRDSSPNLANDHGSKHSGHSGEGGATMLFVGDLHWWTTDAELEAALSEYGRVKNLKFYEERVSGKSKGYCQVEFYDHAAAAACKQGMNGKKFHDRPCVVAFGNTRSIQDMGYAQEKRAHAQIQAQQAQMPSRRAPNDTGGARGGFSQSEREGGRSYGRMGTSGRTGYGLGMGSKPSQTSSARGRTNYMGKTGGSSGGGGVPYSQGHSGPMGGHQSGMMMHQGIMGQGYNPGYGPPMGRGGAAYSGYVMPVPPFSGMVQPFPSLGPGGLPGVAPHVNPAFFGRSATVNGMGMMPGGGLDGPHQGMWGEMSLSGWAGEEHDRRARDGSYAEDGGGMDYGHSTDLGHEKGRTSGEWMERRRRDDRDADWDRERYTDRERDEYKDREREREKNDDWENNRQVRVRNKARMVEEEEEDMQRMRLREEDYGKRRRMAIER